MNYALFNTIRNFTRKMGLNKFIAQLYFENRYTYLKNDYEKRKPSVVSIISNEVTIKMNVMNFSEYLRVMSFRNDEKIIRNLFKELVREENTILWDIGANIGLYSLLAANLNSNIKKVVSFEPEPRCVERIKDNCELNDLHKVKIYSLALADVEGFMDLTINEEFGDGNHSLVNRIISKSQSVLEVKVETGDNIIEKYREEIPTVIKIDVEGAEIKVVKGMLKILSDQKCKAVMCEVHFSILNDTGYINGPMELTGLFKECGFKNIRWVDASHILVIK
jgi:FkbM family methyltransferase